MQNTKMAMVNFHFRHIFLEFNVSYGFGQICMSISWLIGNTTPEPKKLQEDHNEKTEHSGLHTRPYRGDADGLPKQ